MSLNALGCLICGQFTATSVHGIPEWSLQSGPGEACLCAMEETSNIITGMTLASVSLPCNVAAVRSHLIDLAFILIT